MQNRWWRAAIRASIWLLGIWVAFVPVAYAAHTHPSYHLLGMAYAANTLGLFRDFFFLVIVVTVGSFANLLYNFVRMTSPIQDWIKALTIWACLYYIYVLVYGSSRFAELAQTVSPIPADDLASDLIFMGVAVAITLSAEVGIS